MRRHISGQYEAELNSLRDNLMTMGGLVERQLERSCRAFIQHELELVEPVRNDERLVNRAEIELDDQCFTIIARRQPAASDLRIIISVAKSVTELERIGDEAKRIAQLAHEFAATEIPADRYLGLRSMHASAAKLLGTALDAFARRNVDQAIAVLHSDERLDDAYAALTRQQVNAIAAQPSTAEATLSVLWVGRALRGSVTTPVTLPNT